jgi:hypothetical protein
MGSGFQNPGPTRFLPIPIEEITVNSAAVLNILPGVRIFSISPYVLILDQILSRFTKQKGCSVFYTGMPSFKTLLLSQNTLLAHGISRSMRFLANKE